MSLIIVWYSYLFTFRLRDIFSTNETFRPQCRISPDNVGLLLWLWVFFSLADEHMQIADIPKRRIW